MTTFSFAKTAIVLTGLLATIVGLVIAPSPVVADKSHHRHHSRSAYLDGHQRHYGYGPLPSYRYTVPRGVPFRHGWAPGNDQRRLGWDRQHFVPWPAARFGTYGMPAWDDRGRCR